MNFVSPHPDFPPLGALFGLTSSLAIGVFGLLVLAFIIGKLVREDDETKTEHPDDDPV